MGSADGIEVIRIHIVSAVAGPGAGEVTYTYSATLSQPLEQRTRRWKIPTCCRA